MSVGYLSLFVTVFSLIAGVIIWSVKQEGRINALYARMDAQDKYAEDRKADMDRRHNETVDWLKRIEHKIDEFVTNTNLFLMKIQKS